VGGDLKVPEATEAAEGQGWDPPDLAVLHVKVEEVGQVPELVGPQNTLVEKYVTALDCEMLGLVG